MEQNNAVIEDERTEQITVAVSVDSVISAIKKNDTAGVDDCVIAIPQTDGGSASIRRAFRGSERYSNPSAAPVHIRPEYLVEREFRAPPERWMVDTNMMDIPDSRADWSSEDEQKYQEAHERMVEVWETDVRAMVEGEHELNDIGIDIDTKGQDIKLVGVDE